MQRQKDAAFIWELLSLPVRLAQLDDGKVINRRADEVLPQPCGFLLHIAN